MKKLSIGGYFGGKIKLSERIADRVSYKGITTFIDGFSGSAAVTLNMPRHKQRICNDLNPKIFLVLRALSRKDTANEFINRVFRTKYCQEYFDRARYHWTQYDEAFKKLLPTSLVMTEYTPKSFEKANNLWKSFIPENKAIEMAVYAYILLRQSHNGLMKQWRGIKKGNEGAIYENRLLILRDVAEKLEGVEVYNVNTIMLINKYRDSEDVFFYLDPPYEMSTRKKEQSTRAHDYQVEMPDEIQRELINAARNAKCRIIISGYKRDGKSIYDTLVSDSHWKCEKFAETYKSSAVIRTGGVKPFGVEYIWFNF